VRNFEILKRATARICYYHWSICAR